MKTLSLLLALLLGFVPVASAQNVLPSQGAPAPSRILFERGSASYRAGDYAEAEAHWRVCFAEDLGSKERGRLAYNLGNAAHRRGAELQAVGWYTLALRHIPRNTELWDNLEFVRAAAGLEPADRGDLSATFKRLLQSFLPSEARQLFGLGLAFLLLAFLGEAFRGGRFWTRLIWINLALCGLLAMPWISLQISLEGDPVLIVGKPSVSLRSEPRLSLPSTGKLVAGRQVQRIDELPGWVRVEDAKGQRGWIQASAIFELKR